MSYISKLFIKSLNSKDKTKQEKVANLFAINQNCEFTETICINKQPKDKKFPCHLFTVTIFQNSISLLKTNHASEKEYNDILLAIKTKYPKNNVMFVKN
jgi:hypothetical protein